MKKADIKVGGLYAAKVSNKLVTVRVESITERDGNGIVKDGTNYRCTNLNTGRTVVFHSAAKFRGEVKKEVITPTKAAGLLAKPGEGVEEALERVEKKVSKVYKGDSGPHIDETKPIGSKDAMIKAIEKEYRNDDLGVLLNRALKETELDIGDLVEVSKEAGIKVTEDTVVSIDGNLVTLKSGPKVHRDWVKIKDVPASSLGKSFVPVEDGGTGPSKGRVPGSILENTTCPKPTPITPPKSGGNATTPSTNASAPNGSTPIKSTTAPVGGPVSEPKSGTASVTAPSVKSSDSSEVKYPPLIPHPEGKGVAAAIRAAKSTKSNLPPHIIVRARAGCGKTFTAVNGVSRVYDVSDPRIIPSEQQKVIWEALELTKNPRSTTFCAFNRDISQEMARKIPQVKGCQARTLHSMGAYAVRKAFNLTREVDNPNFRVDEIISELVQEPDLRKLRKEKPLLVSATKELVALCKQNLTEPTRDKLMELARYYDVDLGDEPDIREASLALVPRVLERCKDVMKDGYIDFNDMIWLPVVLKLPVWKNDLLVVDEGQDLNRCQQAFAKMAGSRMIVIGDDKQSIYGFAGADTESLSRLEVELSKSDRGCILLPLTVTRRCGKAIVKEAQKIVPDFEAHPSNPEGKVSYAKYTSQKRRTPSGQTEWYDIPTKDSYIPLVQDGDMILCRANAPLVAQLFKFLKMGRKAFIQGRKIAEQIIKLLDKLEAETVNDLITKLSNWLAMETQKEMALRNPSEQRLQLMQDKHDCLMAFCHEAISVEGIKAKVNAVFTDDKTEGIKLSSIHRAKGLEAKRVFYIQGFGRPDDKLSAWEREQEENLRYVAITRAIEELVYVT